MRITESLRYGYLGLLPAKCVTPILGLVILTDFPEAEPRGAVAPQGLVLWEEWTGSELSSWPDRSSHDEGNPGTRVGSMEKTFVHCILVDPYSMRPARST